MPSCITQTRVNPRSLVLPNTESITLRWNVGFVVNRFQFSIFGLLGTPDANRNIVTNFSNIQTLTIDC